MSYYSTTELAQSVPLDREAIEGRALRIAHGEGRTEITELDRIRAKRELLPSPGAEGN